MTVEPKVLSYVGWEGGILCFEYCICLGEALAEAEKELLRRLEEDDVSTRLDTLVAALLLVLVVLVGMAFRDSLWVSATSD